ncbi:hypothetical protein AB1K32_15275 [Metabacillus dongyingensis]|uniref:hypothetical protein n=1 Tax=Metabacillus dongyingensis TaxID=2874282 RepID=UPI003B8C946C
MNINEKLQEIDEKPKDWDSEGGITRREYGWMRDTIKQLQEENEKLMQLSRGFIEQVKKSTFKDENEHHIEMNSSYMDLVFYVGEKESLEEQVRKCMLSAGVDPNA